jgi:hypothetical protein
MGRWVAVDSLYDAMLARLRESIGPAVGDSSSPQQEDAQAQQLAGVLRMLASGVPHLSAGEIQERICSPEIHKRLD